jgi:hypothetical protein
VTRRWRDLASERRTVPEGDGDEVQGQLLAGPNFGGKAIFTADIGLAEMARGKYDFDVVCHYGRPDVFGLTAVGRD